MVNQTSAQFADLTTLRKAAEQAGVEPEFWDLFGQRREASPAALTAVLRSLTGDVAAEPEGSGRQSAARPELLPATLVLPADRVVFPLTLPAGGSSPVRLTVFWEDGGSATQEVSAGAPAVVWPWEPRLGYHRIRVEVGEQSAEAKLIIVPVRAYNPIPAGERIAGLAVSVYGLRSKRNWGCGDFADLRGFATWAHQTLGIDFLALNPLHSIPNRQPYNTSPYLPNSTLYRNGIYLALDEISGYGTSRCVQALVHKQQAELEALRGSAHVEYERVWRLKLRALRYLFREFLRSGQEREQFAAFRATEGEPLEHYTLYCALEEAIHRRDPDIWLWTDWPEEYREPDSAASREFAAANARSLTFYAWIQWQIDRQLAAVQQHCRELGMRVGLYHDLALATDRYGSDLWAYRRFYVAGCRVGAPPDDFSPLGQDWSFPPPRSAAHQADGYRLFRESISKNCRHGGALRIDHVMRFFRLYWIPDGMDATQGVYVRDRWQELLGVLKLESVRQQVAIIGEDLGTVAPEIRTGLAEAGVLSYRLLYFERDKAGEFLPAAVYPDQALVSVSTHDLPTLAGFWEGCDLAARRRAGVLPEHAMTQVQQERQQDKERLLKLLATEGLLTPEQAQAARYAAELTGDVHYAIVGFLASTRCQWLLLNQEDLLKDPDQQNLPGTTEQYPNWRHKLRYSMEELQSEPLVKAYATMFRDWLVRTGRAA